MIFLGATEERDTRPLSAAESYNGTGFSFAEEMRRYSLGEIGTAVYPPGSPEWYEAKGRRLVDQMQGISDLASAATRQEFFVNNITSRDSAIEEAYERRIKTIKAATDVELENPMRVRLSERELRRLNREGPIDPRAFLQQEFENGLSHVQEAHPDQADALTFYGTVEDEARGIGLAAEQDYERTLAESKIGGPAQLAAQFAGGFWGMQRDPLFLGSLFFGPVVAGGKTVASRIASSAFWQGAYNAGLAAAEQYPVQAWRSELGLKSGWVPAIEHVGMAFMFGAIPGAAFRGIHEGLLGPGGRAALNALPDGPLAPAQQAAVRRVLSGAPETGDLEQVMAVARSVMREIDREAPVRGAAEPVRPPAKDIPEPRTYYLGTEEPFDPARFSEFAGRKEKAIFLAETPELTRDYGDIQTAVHIDARNPKTIDWASREGVSEHTKKMGLQTWHNETDMAREIDAARDAGHDVLFIKNIEEQGTRHGVHTQVAVLDHSIIKEGPRPEKFSADDLDYLRKMGLHEFANVEERAVRLGEAMDDAERVTRPPPPKTISEGVTIGRRIGEGVFVEGDVAFVEGAPRERYIKDIAEGGVVPTAKELSAALAATRDAERKYMNALGFSDADVQKLRTLNRQIDNGSDAAMREKDALSNKFPDPYRFDIADEGSLRQLALEFDSLERQGGETLEEYKDGIARVLKRYIGRFTDGDDFARAVFRKAFVEAQAHGFDTKAIGNDVIRRFMGDLSPSDQAFMRQEFEKFLRPKISERPADRTWLDDVRDVETASNRLHDDLTAAALRHADDPIGSPSPAAVAVLDAQKHAPGAGEAAIHDALDNLGVRGNTWVTVPEGEIYLRTGRRPELGMTVEIPNIEFNEGARGQGAFTKYLKVIEDEARQRGFDAVYVEQIFNDRLAGFLRRKGYVTERNALGRGGDQPTLYKKIGGYRTFVADEPYRLSDGTPIQKNDKAASYAADALDSAGNNHAKAIREINELLALKQRQGDDNNTGPAWQKAADILREWKTKDLKIAGEHLTEAEMDARAVAPLAAKPADPIVNEVEARIAEAAPRTEREAQMAASEALEDIGNRQSMVRARAQMEADRLPAPPPPVEGAKLPPARSKDPLDKIPLARDDGTPTMVSHQQAARAGERETHFADIIRECK